MLRSWQLGLLILGMIAVYLNHKWEIRQAEKFEQQVAETETDTVA